MQKRSFVLLAPLALSGWFAQGVPVHELRVAPNHPRFCESRVLAEKKGAPETFEQLVAVRNHQQMHYADKNVLAAAVESRLAACTSLTEAMDVIDQLVKLGERSEGFRFRFSGPQGSAFHDIMKAIDLVGPMARFRDELTREQELILQTNYAYLFGVHRDVVSTNPEKTRTMATINMKLVSLFFEPWRAKEVAELFVDAEVQALAELQDAYFNGPVLPMISRAAMGALGALPTPHLNELSDYAWNVIKRDRNLQKIYEEMGNHQEMLGAWTRRRNAETLVTLARRAEIGSLVAGWSGASTLEEIGAATTRFWRSRNGQAGELSFATIVGIAREVHRMHRSLGVSGDTFWIGSFPNGRAFADDSDIDLIFPQAVMLELEEDFGKNNYIEIDDPQGLRAQARARIMMRSRAIINQTWLERPTPQQPLFSSVDSRRVAYGRTGLAEREAILFGYGAINQSLSIRINAAGIFLIVMDPYTFTSYEIRIPDAI